MRLAPELEVDARRGGSVAKRLLVFGVAFGAYALCRYFLLGKVSPLLQRPLVPEGSAGLGKVMGHATWQLPMVLLCLSVWWGLSRAGLISPPSALLTLGQSRARTLRVALIGTAALLVFTVACGFALGAKFRVHIDPWLMLANVLSNLYEELVYRGFLFHAALAAFGRAWPALPVQAAVFGFSHEQYPLPAQIGVLFVGLIMGVTYAKSGSLAAPWLVHQLGDNVGDAILKL